MAKQQDQAQSVGAIKIGKSRSVLLFVYWLSQDLMAAWHSSKLWVWKLHISYLLPAAAQTVCRGSLSLFFFRWWYQPGGRCHYWRWEVVGRRWNAWSKMLQLGESEWESGKWEGRVIWEQALEREGLRHSSASFTTQFPITAVNEAGILLTAFFTT